jgi:hypothetical protein
MPVRDIWHSQSPFNALKGKSCLDVKVFSDIQIVIKVDKLVISNLPVNRKGRHDKKQGCQECQEITAHMNDQEILSRESIRC